MAQTEAVDLLEGYRLNQGMYNLRSNWKAKDILNLSHSGSFGGPSQAYTTFIGASGKYGQDVTTAIQPGTVPPLSTLDSSKRYRLILTVIAINQNTATDATHGVLTIAMGSRGTIVQVDTTLCDFVVGSQIVVAMPNPSYLIRNAILGSNVSATKWDFDFKVKFEEW